MLIYKTGDILKATENIICHQVNVDGVMGGGLALQIAKQYPEVEKQYQSYCENCNNDYERLKGRVYEIEVENKYTIIAVPFKYGCGIAKGDWNIVSKIFEDLSNEYGIDISVYKMESIEQ